MVCVECYLPFVAMLLHFLWPYFAALVKQTTGIELAAPKRAVCPIPAASAVRKQPAPGPLPAKTVAAPLPQAEAEAEASSAAPAEAAAGAAAGASDPASVD